MYMQSAKLTTGPMPDASKLNARPVVLSSPLARLASENLIKLNCGEKNRKYCYYIKPPFQVISPDYTP